MRLDISTILQAILLGMGVGGLYLLGLWITVRRIIRSPRPVILSVGSFYIRGFAVAAGFYLIMDGRVDRLLASTIGFLIVRSIVAGWAMRGSHAARG